MKRKYLLFAPIVAVALSACSLNGKAYPIKDYILKTNYKSDMRILQLTDTHIGDKDDQELHFKFMDLTIKEANPDFIVVTGDLFTFAGQATAERFFNWLDSYGKPWTVTFGNHDEQCYFSIDWLTSYLNNFGSNCLFKDIQDDKVHGNANFAINVMKDDKIFEQFIVMDSNRYNFNGYFGYDCFKENQIEWYKDLVNQTTADNGGEVVQSLMFYHIPLPEINDAWDKSKAGEPDAIYEYGDKGEKTCPPDKDFHFFNTIRDMGSTKAMFFGHDHVNDFRVTYQDVTFCYGIKSTDRIYYNDSLLGGQVIVLHDDHTLSYEHFFHTYAEVK